MAIFMVVQVYRREGGEQKSLRFGAMSIEAE
jgi:hypothetical protein